MNKKYFAIKSASEKRIKDLAPNIKNTSGIYIFHRIDEHGIKYAYVGQSVHLLDRLASHLMGYSHIDLSIKKHGLKKPYGYELKIEYCNVEELDNLERQKIKEYANLGYQLRNNTIGGQDSEKKSLGDNVRKGYQQGLKQGYLNALKDIQVYFKKYLDVSIKEPTNKIKERKLKEFNEKIRSSLHGEQE